MTEDLIKLAHGGGGKLMDQLLREKILPQLGLDGKGLLDSAMIAGQAGQIAFTTDSYVVKPLEFPGGDIGYLSVCGTVNDLAMVGARPKALSLALIIEEGLSLAKLTRIIASVVRAADQAGVKVVTGDTKVVEHGSAEGLFINTSGVGYLLDNAQLGFGQIAPDDAVIISGTIGDHGLAVISQRENLEFTGSLKSDVAPVARLANDLVEKLGRDVKFLRDPTRGGLATVLADIAETTGLCIEIDEQALPIQLAARSAAEMLGLDVLTAANEGKFVAVVEASKAQQALEICRSDELGKAAAIIGKLSAASDGQVIMFTAVGGQRIVQKPYGEELPRIC